MTTAKRRARRIAADEAHSWARNLRLRNIQAKMVLSMLTLYVDAEGVCFVSIPSLAEDCELSAQTVRRRLGWLHEIGAISRQDQWIDAKGNRNGDGNGKRTTDRIRLLLEVEPELIEARAAGRVALEDEIDEAAGDAEFSPACQIGLNSEPSPAPGLRQPYHSGKGLTSEPEPEDPPKSPSGGFPDEQKPGEVEPEEFAGAFEAYVGHEVMRRDLALAEFRLLPPEERAWCRHAVPLCMAKLRELKQRRPINFHLWVRTRGFKEFPAPGAEPVKPAAPQRRFVQGDELAGLAVAVKIAERRELRIIREQDLGEGVWTQLAPQADLVAMAVHAGADLNARQAWLVVDAGTPQFAAWRDRLALWLGAEPQAERIFLEPFDQGVHGVSSSNPNFRLRKSKQGFRVPAPWPPRRDGSWQVAGESE